MKSIEIFAGAGGLAIGTSQAGFEHRAVIEWDADACATLRLNARPGAGHAGRWSVNQVDVSKYEFKQHRGDVEFISGGPPCQPFSLGGKYGGRTDSRNMFPHAIRAVREIQPKAFLIENVKGLLRRQFSNYYGYILQQLRFPEVGPQGDEEWTDHLARLEKIATSGQPKGLQYNIVHRLLNAADYGVPQHRHRVLIVGIRSDLGVEFSFPEKTHSEESLLYEQWVSGEYWDRHRVPKKGRPEIPKRCRGKIANLGALWQDGMLRPWRTVRDAISDLPKVEMGQACPNTPNHFYNPGARSYAGHTGSLYDEPAKALKAGDHGVPGGENTLRVGDDCVRYFSVRECARIQTFPDEWVFSGSWTESMRQLGNAVPVELARAAAKRLHDVLSMADTQPPNGSKFWKFLVPSADAIRTRSPFTRHLAAKPALVPFRSAVRDEREFSGEYPPVAIKRQIPAPHFGQSDVFTSADLAHMFAEARSQCTFALGRAP